MEFNRMLCADPKCTHRADYHRSNLGSCRIKGCQCGKFKLISVEYIKPKFIDLSRSLSK
jgi:hypothetical protein